MILVVIGQIAVIILIMVVLLTTIFDFDEWN